MIAIVTESAQEGAKLIDILWRGHLGDGIDSLGEDEDPTVVEKVAEEPYSVSAD